MQRVELSGSLNSAKPSDLVRASRFGAAVHFGAAEPADAVRPSRLVAASSPYQDVAGQAGGLPADDAANRETTPPPFGLPIQSAGLKFGFVEPATPLQEKHSGFGFGAPKC